jgi:hypothetical protein
MNAHCPGENGESMSAQQRDEEKGIGLDYLISFGNGRKIWRDNLILVRSAVTCLKVT